MATHLLSFSSVLMILANLFVVQLLVQIVWRRRFHPLKHIPGPWLNSVSELPATWALVTGRQHLYYRSLHERYGSVVRVSPGEISFIGVEAREEIYGLRKNGLNMEKSPIFLGAVGSVDGQTGLSLALNQDHNRQRRALGYLFTTSALLRQETLLSHHIDKLIGRWERMASRNSVVDVSSWYTYLAFDLMGDLCFAEPFGCLDQASATEWSTSVIQVFIAATWTQAIRRLTGVGTWFESVAMRLLIPRRAAEWRRIHLENSRQKTLRRLADRDRDDHPDFMYHILAHNESRASLSETEIVLNMALFISAGTDTTATALTGWTYYVCSHPDVYRRLIREIRTSVNNADELNHHTVTHKLKFLSATIDETLRLFPPSAASQQRIVPPGGGAAVINNVWVPAGTTVAVPPWASNRSTINFHDPDRFCPERWLSSSSSLSDKVEVDTDIDAKTAEKISTTSSVFANDRLNASVPFGNGPRVCIGRNLARLELQLVAAKILYHFDLELDPVSTARSWRASPNDDSDGAMRPMKVFHSMTRPELLVKLRKR